MDEIRPTWRLAWGLWWRWFLIGLGVSLVIGAIMTLLVFLLGISLASFVPWGAFFGGF